MRMIVRWLAILSVLLAAACEGIGEEPTATPPSPPTQTTEPTVAPTREPLAEPTPFFGRSVQSGRATATLRILHTAQDAPALDIYLDGAEYARSLGQNLSTGLAAVLPGAYTLHIEPRGEDTVLAETPLTLAAGRTTDVIVVAGDEGPQLVVVDGPDETLDPGTGMVRTVNALPDGGTIQTVLNGSTIPGSMALGESNEPYKFDQGDLDVAVQSDGTEILAERRRVRDLTYMLLVVTGTLERPQLLVQEAPMLSRYSLRIVNASPDAREVDVYFDEALVAAGLAYGSATERTAYANAPATVSVHAANADLAVSTPLLDGYEITPRAGGNATLAIYGTADDLRAMWIEEDLSPVPAGRSRVVFAHVAPEVNALRAGVNSNDLEELQPFAYGSASAPIYFGDGEIRLFFRDAADADNIVELRQAVPLPAGQAILYFVTGSESEDEGETPPLMFTETVSVDETLSAEPDDPTRGVYRVRFVNAIVSQPLIDVEQEGQIAASNLRYGEGTELITLDEESVAFNAHMSSSDATVVDQHIGFPRPGDYTIYIFGTPENGISSALVDDTALPLITSDEQAPTVRLVNLTQDPSAVFGLALSPVRAGDSTPVPTPQPVFTLQPVPTVAGQTAIDLGRRRLPVGAPVPIVGIKGGDESRLVMTQTRAETTVINQVNEIVAALGMVEYATGTHTDIVVFEYRTATTTEGAAFALVYPPR